jgi:GT2 family glycosyltransferase
MIICSIVLYNNKADMIRPLLNHLLNCTLITKLYLIDNSPTNALQALATPTKVEYIFNNANLGYGAGHNIALKQALTKSRYHLVLNPDIAFENGTIETLCQYMEDNPSVGLVMPKVTYPNGSLQYTCKLLPTPFDLIFRRFLPASFTKKRMYRFEMRQTGYDKIMEVPYLSGCFMFLRVDALKKAGLFDERFFMYPEDIDLTRRIYVHYKTMYYPYAQITHVHERASYKSMRLLLVHIFNMVKYFNKWGWFIDKERVRINKKIVTQFSNNG